MDKANLPIEKAFEPKEEARQPSMLKKTHLGKNKQKLTFTEDETHPEKTCSQSSTNTYKDVLSQPASGLSHRQKLVWLQKRRCVGIWAQCDDCQRWRYLPDVLDSFELPDKWYCHMNPDKHLSECSIPEVPLNVHQEEDLIHGEYSAGSLVWARMPGWPWWPALVDDCPDTEQYYWLDGFSDIPTHYNVVFFDSTEVTRAWVAPDNLKPYAANKNSFRPAVKNNLKKRLETAKYQADEASKLEPKNRLAKYSFIARYDGPIVKPRKINRNVLKKYQQRLQKKFNVPFPLESSDSDEDECVSEEPKAKKNKKSEESKPKKINKVEEPKAKNKKSQNGPLNNKSKKTDKKYLTKKQSTIVEETPMVITEPSEPHQESTNLIEEAVKNPTRKLSTVVKAVIDDLQDSLIHSSNANATCDPSTDDVITIDKDFMPTSNVLVPETETQSEVANNMDTTIDSELGNRKLVSPSSDDFEF